MINKGKINQHKDRLRDEFGLHVSAYPVLRKKWFYSISRITGEGVKTLLGSPCDPKKVSDDYYSALSKGVREALKYID